MTRAKFLLGFLLAPFIAVAGILKNKKETDSTIYLTVSEIRAARHCLQARDVEPYPDDYFRLFIGKNIKIVSTNFFNQNTDTTVVGCKITRLISHDNGAVVAGWQNSETVVVKTGENTVYRKYQECYDYEMTRKGSVETAKYCG